MLSEKDIKIGVWRFNENFWSDHLEIEDIDLYKTERLVLDTSTLGQKGNLSSYNRKKLMTAWEVTLPKLENVKFIFLPHQVNQNFFDAICQMKNLEGLYMKWTTVSDLKAIYNLERLKHLYFGSTPRITDLSGIESLKNLITLTIENFKNCTDFTLLESLKNLEILKINGGYHRIESLQFLKPLKKLKVLSLQADFDDGNIEPVLELSQLQNLFLFDKYLKNGNMERIKSNLKYLRYGVTTK